jgi:hypothetical protein
VVPFFLFPDGEMYASAQDAHGPDG